MTVSVFDLFKIGIGPSSSHTVGPMLAARRFRDELERDGCKAARIAVELFGSLAWTGRGHATDIAVCLGLLGETPAAIDPDGIADLMEMLRRSRGIALSTDTFAAFDPATDIVLNTNELLPRHSNGMRFRAFDEAGRARLERVYYSPGGGFIVADDEAGMAPTAAVPFLFRSATELLRLCATENLPIADIQLINELALRPRDVVLGQLDVIRNAMFACIDRGLRTAGDLPGNLRVRRRARALVATLEDASRCDCGAPHDTMAWVSAYAIAVNEENAAGGRVVTAPTNGAAGVVPAVLRYLVEFCPGSAPHQSRVFLLTSTAIGGLIKRNASISGAEVGCQGEVGSAASMAAAGLAAALGATPAQVENAAEIAMEHHLGLTCDPIGGLVQIPCIERNAIGAHTAIAAASLAIRGDGMHRVSLDEVVETMRQTGADMQTKYKETSLGGLAVNVAEC